MASSHWDGSCWSSKEWNHLIIMLVLQTVSWGNWLKFLGVCTAWLVGRLEQEAGGVMSLLSLPRSSYPSLDCPTATLWWTWLVKMSSTLSAGNLVSHGAGPKWRQGRPVLTEIWKGLGEETVCPGSTWVTLTIDIWVLKYPKHFCGPVKFWETFGRHVGALAK